MLNLFNDYNSFPKESGIYKITTLHNGHCYIGSALSLKKRMKDHKNRLVGGSHHVNRLQRIFNKHGKDNFIVEFLFISCTNFKLNSLKHRQLIILEEHYINKFNAVYNTIKTPTSQKNNPSISIPVYQYDKYGNFIQEWSSSMEVKRTLSINPQYALRENKRSSGGFLWSNIKKDKLPNYKSRQGSTSAQKISIYDLFGKKINTFESTSECARVVFPEKDFSNTRQCIDKYAKDSRSLYGYRFARGEKEQLDNTINLKHRINFIILQFDLNMNFIKIWGRISDARKELKITSIYDNISGKTKMAGGFIWKKLGYE